jgi:NADPH:quinone reductase-like Zn-dependent oxidoreductase
MIRGFWLRHWYQSAKPDEVIKMFEYLAPLVASGAIWTPVAETYDFDQATEAIAKATHSRGKVLFTPIAMER